MRPTWVLSAPEGPLDGPMNLAIRVALHMTFQTWSRYSKQFHYRVCQRKFTVLHSPLSARERGNCMSTQCTHKQVSRTGTSIYIPQILRDVITCPCPWYLLLAHNTLYILFHQIFTEFCCAVCFFVVALCVVSCGLCTHVIQKKYKKANDPVLGLEVDQQKQNILKIERL